MSLTIMSFISRGTATVLRIMPKYSGDPLNKLGWVTMDNPTAPDPTILVAMSVGREIASLLSATILPLEGDANFISVISGACGHDRIDFLILIGSWPQ